MLRLDDFRDLFQPKCFYDFPHWTRISCSRWAKLNMKSVLLVSEKALILSVFYPINVFARGLILQWNETWTSITAIPWWDYTAKRINGKQILLCTVGVSHELNNGNLHWVGPEPAFVSSHSFSFGGAGRAQVSSQHRHSLALDCSQPESPFPCPLLLPHTPALLLLYFCCSTDSAAASRPQQSPCCPLGEPTVELITHTSSGAKANLLQCKHIFPSFKDRKEHLHFLCS